MGKNQHNAACVFGAVFLLKQLRNLEKDLNTTFDPQDIEPIHRLRVSSRRLRTGIKHFRDCLPEKTTRGLEDEIRRLGHALGKARDLDIQIETLNALYEEDLPQTYKPGYRRLLLRLKQSRSKAQEKVEHTLSEMKAKSRINKMITRLETSASSAEDLYLYTPSLYARAFAAIHADLNEFLSYENFVHSPDNMEKLHALRIAGKHLRYSMEIFAPVYKQALLPYIQLMKDIQDQLGTMHDNDVWVTWLPKFLKKEEKRVDEYFGNTGPLKGLIPGIHHLIEDRKNSRDAAYQSFLATWETLAYENVWENLHTIIHAPLNIESAMTYLAEEEVDAVSGEQDHPPAKGQDEVDPKDAEPGFVELELPPTKTDPPTN